MNEEDFYKVYEYSKKLEEENRHQKAIIDNSKKSDLISRKRVLKMIDSKLAKEEQLLKEANTNYHKRLYSYRVTLLRDLHDMVEAMLGVN